MFSFFFYNYQSITCCFVGLCHQLMQMMRKVYLSSSDVHWMDEDFLCLETWQRRHPGLVQISTHVFAPDSSCILVWKPTPCIYKSCCLSHQLSALTSSSFHPMLTTEEATAAAFEAQCVCVAAHSCFEIALVVAVVVALSDKRTTRFKWLVFG